MTKAGQTPNCRKKASDKTPGKTFGKSSRPHQHIGRIEKEEKEGSKSRGIKPTFREAPHTMEACLKKA